MMSCTTAPLIKTIKLLHAGKAKAETATPVIAAIYASLPTLAPDSHSQFELYSLSYITLAWVRVRGGCPVEGRESASVIPFFDLQTLYAPTTKHAPSIKSTTELHCGCMIDILHVLSRETPSPDQADATSFSVPPLKKVQVYDFMFVHSRDMMFSKLKEQLLARNAAGAGVDTSVVGPKLLYAGDVNEFKVSSIS
ncbi:hypothetical protein PC9H_001662 [Pleurotus ostreatus]|uniref:Uncharacterized protein n=1 Tax=Pleurotus ostreatus TaxID=5322 RepID=A0A8H7A3J2_PLEOS|nr:uncharacterized protein PC9H_001662 [Pleurotus ostreatus]KAF7441313.1 hypothetical protein PC9H_001662 [Pleurotus ostreatus]